MLYDAIVNGARAVAFYGGQVEWLLERAGRRQRVELDVLARGPSWSRVGDLGDERRRPALVGPDWPTRISVDDGATQVLARRGATANDLWLIAARSGRGRARVTLSGLPRWATTGRVYTEGRRVWIESGSLTDSFAQWDVHVYRITRAPRGTGGDVDSRLRVTVTMRDPALGSCRRGLTASIVLLVSSR